MAVMGILACKMLQDEIIYLIQKDPDISDIVIVENGEHEEFIQKLDEIGIPYRFISSACDLPDLDRNSDACSSSLACSSITLVV